MQTAREFYAPHHLKRETVVIIVGTRSENAIRGALAVGGANLEKGVKVLPLHAFQIPVPTVIKTLIK